jgi:NitT/TauT family transport system substrate-binding protein
MDHVRVAATGRAFNYLPQEVAVRRRIFRSLGLEVTAEVYDPWTDAVAALEHGEADAVLGGIWAPLMYRLIGRDYTCFAQLTSACPLVLVGRSEPDGFNWSAMDGQVIIVPGGGHCAGFIALTSAMHRDGYDVTRTRPIHDVTEDFGVEMFAGGVGDYLVVPRLVASRLGREMDTSVVTSLAVRAGRIPWSVYYTRRDLALERATAFRRFREAIQIAMRWLTTSPVPQIADQLNLTSPPGIGGSVDTITRYREEGVWFDAEIPAGPFDYWQESLRVAGLLNRRLSRDEVVFP